MLNTMTLQERFNLARTRWEEKHSKQFVQAELVRYTGASKGTVSQWFTGNTQAISYEYLVPAARYFDVSIEWLGSGKGAMEPQAIKQDQKMYGDAEEAPTLGEFRKHPVVGAAQLGDNGYFAELEYPVGHGDGYVMYPSRDPEAYAVRCKGDSMKPRIKSGEFVILEPNHPVVNGDDVLVRSVEGRVMVKELLYIRDGIVHLGSINEAHPKITIPETEIAAMHFVSGIVKSALWSPE